MTSSSQFSHVIYKDEIKRSRHCEYLSISRKTSAKAASKNNNSGNRTHHREYTGKADDVRQTTHGFARQQKVKRKPQLDMNEDFLFSGSEFCSQSFSSPLKTSFASFAPSTPGNKAKEASLKHLQLSSSPEAAVAAQSNVSGSRVENRKLLVIGDSCAGKTSFVRRYVTKVFTGDYPYTAGGVYNSYVTCLCTTSPSYFFYRFLQRV